MFATAGVATNLLSPRAPKDLQDSVASLWRPACPLPSLAYNNYLQPFIGAASSSSPTSAVAAAAAFELAGLVAHSAASLTPVAASAATAATVTVAAAAAAAAASSISAPQARTAPSPARPVSGPSTSQPSSRSSTTSGFRPPKRSLSSREPLERRQSKKQRLNSKSSQQPSTEGADAQLMAVNGDPSSASSSQAAALSVAAAAAAAAQAKPKRVRTGCLTCRERHLKCDEGLPVCLNCRKSARECKRGVRLNFIDTQCEAPPVLAPNDDEWQLNFLDESRDIASEYTDGLGRYANVDQLDISLPGAFADNAQNMSGATFEGTFGYDYNAAGNMPGAPGLGNQTLPSIQGMVATNGEKNAKYYEQLHENRQRRSENASVVNSRFAHNSVMSFGGGAVGLDGQMDGTDAMQDQQQQQQQSGYKNLLDTADETLYMQVFVEEVGVWMDSMDPMKHFSRIMPFHALGQPMLLNAFLACGVRHLTLVNPAQFQDEKALQYYEIASQHLLRALQNPNRDSVICATTAVILNVYEIMTEKALPRMNHIAGARALIKECGWSARSTGIGAACFWLNVGLETLSNLHFNWQMSWSPDEWNLDTTMDMETVPCREELWTHRMLYIIAKICNFRATAPRGQTASPEVEHSRRQKRMNEWLGLKQLLDTWENNSPRTMKPMAYLFPYQTSSKSAFPEVWIIKRTSVIARLFYHTAVVLLTQNNPAMVPMRDLELHHAHMICGIVAHGKDRGVASVALRCLAHAAEALTNRREQEEVLEIFTRIHRETGWRIGFIPKDLTEKWGWGPDDKAKANSVTLPTHVDPTSHLRPQSQQLQQRMAAQAASAEQQGSSMGTLSLGLSSDSGLTSPTTSLPLGSPPGNQYQFDQYAEMQKWKAQQATAPQRRPSMLMPGQPGQPNGMGGGQGQTSPAFRKLPQGIVNPAFSAGLPKAYQEWYVPAVPPSQADRGQGLELAFQNGNGVYAGQGHGAYHFS